MSFSAGMISIFEASVWLHGADRVRVEASMATKTQVTLSQTFEAALRNDQNGKRLYAAIVRLGNEATADMTGAPPYQQATDRIMQSRSARIGAVRGVHAAVLATVDYLEDALSGDRKAQMLLEQSYKDALRAIDGMPGRAVELTDALKALYLDVFSQASSDAGRQFAAQLLAGAEKAYLAEEQEVLLFGTAKSNERSSDLDTM